MTITYRDSLGIIAETLSDGESGESIDFCDGFAYFASIYDDGAGNMIERKIPISAIVHIEK